MTMTSIASPATLVGDTACRACLLNSSDSHATIVLQQGDVQSLLKVNLLPFRQRLLPSVDLVNPKEHESTIILNLLKQYDFLLSSESGAEYSYYQATPRSLESFAGYNHLLDFGPLRCELVSPATDRQIQRASPSSPARLVHETPELYNHVTEPYIEELKRSGSLSWIDNVLSGDKEKERALLDTKDFLLNIDTKWRSHLDPKTTTRETWFQHESVEDLYCLAILKDKDISTLRDVRGSHLRMLQGLLRECQKVILDTYGVSSDMIRCFFHYQPQFYHAHIHFTRIHNEIGAQVERGHLIQDVIQNLEMDPEFYAKRTITYSLRTSDPLLHRISSFQSAKVDTTRPNIS